MTLDDLLEAVRNSDRNDWNVELCAGFGAGPSYRDRLLINNAPPQQQIEVASQSHVAAFRKDVSITMAWGMQRSATFVETWATGFPDPNASSDWFDVFYNGALVYRDYYVVVDGARAFLPAPGLEARAWTGFATTL